MSVIRKGAYLLLGCVLATSIACVTPVQASEIPTVGISDLSDIQVAAPAPDEVIPDANQYRYQKNELPAFMHYGPNTFNEIEWGERYGNRPPSDIFRLSKDFDAQTLVTTLKEAGFKMLIVTAKHHDGFCLWASEHTDYDISSTGYKGGKGDILAEISAAASEHNMDMGLYLSPWDIHEKSYGYYDQNHKPTTKQADVLDYNDFYDNQLKEILGNDKYGNKGRFVEIWMDGAKGSGANAQDYDFARWYKTIQKYEGKASGADADAMLFGAESRTTVRWIGNEWGYAHENTWSKSTVNKQRDTIDSGRQGHYFVGKENGNQWTVPEADARITAGWFWGNNKKTPKTMSDLSEMYFRSVGHNATLLLNVPPNDQGTIDEPILKRVKEFGRAIHNTFANNLLKNDNSSWRASNVRGNSNSYSPSNLLDKNDDTHWSTDDNTSQGSVEFTLDQTTRFDVISIEEAIKLGQRINSYTVEVKNGNQPWQVVQQGVTIGAKRLIRTPVMQKADKLRITVSTGTNGKPPVLSEVGLYRTAEGFGAPKGAPEGMDIVDIKDSRFVDTAGKWNDETGPQYVGGTNQWARRGSEKTMTFTGSKLFLVGTKDPNHGEIEVTINGKPAIVVNTASSSRKLGQIIFTSEDLEFGEHTVRIRVKTKAAGLESAYTVNNDGLGMVGLEQASYTMGEDESLELTLHRVGGSKGRAEVSVQPNPGTAIQDDFNTEPKTVVFEDGQTVAKTTIETRRNKRKTGSQDFTVELVPITEKLIAGMINVANITIEDADTYDAQKLSNMVTDYSRLKSVWYVSGYQKLQDALAQAQAVLDNPQASGEQGANATRELSKAYEALVERVKYTDEDRFVFPTQIDEVALLESEFGVVKNTGADDEAWKMSVASAPWSSHGKYIDAMNQNDTLTIPYTAKRPGVYKVVLTYRSGSSKNAIAWSSPDEVIDSGTASTNSPDNNSSVTRTATFEIVVNEATDGNWVLTAPAGNAPQCDKMEISLVTPFDLPLIFGYDEDEDTTDETVPADAPPAEEESADESPSAEVPEATGEVEKADDTPKPVVTDTEVAKEEENKAQPSESEQESAPVPADLSSSSSVAPKQIAQKQAEQKQKLQNTSGENETTQPQTSNPDKQKDYQIQKVNKQAKNNLPDTGANIVSLMLSIAFLLAIGVVCIKLVARKQYK